MISDQRYRYLLILNELSSRLQPCEKLDSKTDFALKCATDTSDNVSNASKNFMINESPSTSQSHVDDIDEIISKKRAILETFRDSLLNISNETAIASTSTVTITAQSIYPTSKRRLCSKEVLERERSRLIDLGYIIVHNTIPVTFSIDKSYVSKHANIAENGSAGRKRVIKDVVEQFIPPARDNIKEQQSNAAKEVGDQYEKKEEKSKKPSFRPIASMITSSIPIIPSSSTSASTTASVSTSSSLNVSLKNETIPIIVDDPPTTTSSSQQKKKGRPRKHPI